MPEPTVRESTYAAQKRLKAKTVMMMMYERILYLTVKTHD
jgi:hypothetical protein